MENTPEAGKPSLETQKISWKSWGGPVLSALVFLMLVGVGKVAWEASWEQQQAQQMDAPSSFPYAPEWGFAAQQSVAGFSLAPAAVERLAQCVQNPACSPYGRRTVAMSLAGRRSVRSPDNALVQEGVQRFGNPSALGRLLAALAFWGWLGSAVAWIYTGYDAQGQARPGRIRAALLCGVCSVLWGGALLWV